MGKNVGSLDRALRVIVGIALVAIVFVGPKTPWGWIGLVPLVTAALGWCPLYTLIGVRTCSTEPPRVKGLARLAPSYYSEARRRSDGSPSRGPRIVLAEGREAHRESGERQTQGGSTSLAPALCDAATVPALASHLRLAGPRITWPL